VPRVCRGWLLAQPEALVKGSRSESPIEFS
jgi:hypothetical protein